MARWALQIRGHFTSAEEVQHPARPCIIKISASLFARTLYVGGTLSGVRGVLNAHFGLGDSGG